MLKKTSTFQGRHLQRTSVQVRPLDWQSPYTTTQQFSSAPTIVAFKSMKSFNSTPCRRRRRRVVSALLFFPATWLLLTNGSDDVGIMATLAGGTNSVLYKISSSIHSTRQLGHASAQFRAFGVGSANNIILQQHDRRLLSANYDGAFDYDTVSTNGTCSDDSNTSLDASETYAGTTSTGECADLCDSSSIGCAAFHFDEDQCQLFVSVPSNNTLPSTGDPGVCAIQNALLYLLAFPTLLLDIGEFMFDRARDLYVRP